VRSNEKIREEGLSLPSFFPIPDEGEGRRRIAIKTIIHHVVDITPSVCAHLWMRTTIELPAPLFRVAKSLAAERGLSLKTFFTDALQKAVNSSADERKRMDRPPIGRTRRKSFPARTNAQLGIIMEEEEVEKSQ
jgi:hypothetical protein